MTWSGETAGNMIIRSVLVCAALAASVSCEELSVNRHFRGDIFSKDGKFNQPDTERSIPFRSICPPDQFSFRVD